MKKKMAFVDLTNFENWPMGGMLEYELAILPYLAMHYDLDLWGYSVNGVANLSLTLNDKEYIIRTCGNCSTGNRLIPNFVRGLLFLKYRKEFKDKYDVIYVHSGSCMSALSYCIDKKNTKLVYHQHGLSYLYCNDLIILLQKPFYRIAQKKSDLVFCVSDELSTKRFAESKGDHEHKKFISISSPVELSKFDSQKIADRINKRKDTKISTFIYVGRLDSWKNPELLVYAFALYVKNVDSDALFKIVGNGLELKNLERLRTELRIERNLILTGAVPHSQIHNLLSEADVFMIASKGEGASVSVLEAYASGLPVICAKVPGLERQVVDGRTGFFVDEYTAQAFYEKMVNVSKVYYNMALNCLEEAQLYDAKKITNEITANIDSLF